MPRFHDSSGVHVLPALLAHRAIRPLWHCRRGCGTWPCPIARLALRASYDGDPVGLAVYMAGCLFDAAGDLYRLNPDDMPGADALYVRFVGWTRRRLVE
ncbi:hypothetical protein [Micromonospora chersina]